jgi:hypothetical protein
MDSMHTVVKLWDYMSPGTCWDLDVFNEYAMFAAGKLRFIRMPFTLSSQN